ncbi:hypothetical protein [Cypionkella sp.]|uniref:hypothetical protein n=1 Tax=Cypionkella sp. TaxID=2811411 RepID=UPI00351EB5A3
MPGFDGNDTLAGGRGDDLAPGEEDNDLILPGDGTDTNWIDDAFSATGFQRGQLGDDSVHSGAGDDTGR